MFILLMIVDTFAQVLRTLGEHKLRSFLTMFGIAWGVGSLLLLVGLGEGFRSGNEREMAEFGRDIMFIFPGRAPVIEGSIRSARNYLLTYQDYVDVRNTAPYVHNAAPILAGDVRSVSEFASTNGEIIGVEAQFAKGLEVKGREFQFLLHRFEDPGITHSPCS
jgi:putative ABC transport system permease protein